MKILFAVFEIVVNISEPLLLLVLLLHKHKPKPHALPFAIIGVALIALGTTLMNGAGFGYFLTAFITLAIYCGYALLFFMGDTRMKLIWA